MREWFAEVQRRLDAGADPFLEPTAGRTDGDEAGEAEGGETQGEASTATEGETGTGAGEEDEEEDEGDEEEDGDDTDDSEVWEPSRSVRKSLSVSED